MNKTKYLLFAALGVGVALLLTSDKTKNLRDDIAENAGKWKDKLGKMGKETGDKLADLKKMVSNQVEGLSEDARERIQDVLNEGAKKTKRVKRKVSNELA